MTALDYQPPSNCGAHTTNPACVRIFSKRVFSSDVSIKSNGNVLFASFWSDLGGPMGEEMSEPDRAGFLSSDPFSVLDLLVHIFLARSPLLQMYNKMSPVLESTTDAFD